MQIGFTAIISVCKIHAFSITVVFELRLDGPHYVLNAAKTCEYFGIVLENKVLNHSNMVCSHDMDLYIKPLWKES